MKTKPIQPNAIQTIITLCLITFIPCLFSQQFQYNFGGLGVAIYHNHQIYRLFTAMFCHAGLLHLFCNMMSLNAVGNAIEDEYGTLNTWIIFLVSGVFATLCSTILSMNILTVGASGAICGLIGAYLCKLKAYGGLTLETGARIVLPILIMSLLPGIDMTAHIAGLIAGLIAGFVTVALK